MDMAIEVARQNHGDVILRMILTTARVLRCPNRRGLSSATGNEVGSIVGDELLRYRDVSDDLVPRQLYQAGSYKLLGITALTTKTHLRDSNGWHPAQKELRAVDSFWLRKRLDTALVPLFEIKMVQVALILSDLIAALKSKGQTLLDRLTELYRVTAFT